MDSIEKQDDITTTSEDITEKGTADVSVQGDTVQEAPAENTSPDEGNDSDACPSEQATDYGKIAREDLVALKEQFPETAELESITELDNPLRYAALRDMGLTPREAYLATQKRQDAYDNRNHLRGSVPRPAGTAGGSMSQAELSAARELFSGLSDRELQRLYKTVTK